MRTKRMICKLMAFGIMVPLAVSPAVLNTAFAEEKISAAVFYNSYGGNGVSDIRTALDAALENAGIRYQDYDCDNDYDGGSSETVPAEELAAAVEKGAEVLAVHLTETDSADTLGNILDQAGDRLVIFFQDPTDTDLTAIPETSVSVSSDHETAARVQGKMIGDYLVENYDGLDLDGDGRISYVMFRGQKDVTPDSVEAADDILKKAGRPELVSYEGTKTDRYPVGVDGVWSAAAAADYVKEIVSENSESESSGPELVIAEDDETAMAVIEVLEDAGIQQPGRITIPVFGAGATEAALEAVSVGTMAGTAGPDTEGMADAIALIAGNFITGAGIFEDIGKANIEGDRYVRIPYRCFVCNLSGSTGLS